MRVRAVLGTGLALARLLLTLLKAILYYTFLRARLWARSQVYKARFRLALRGSGIPPRFRREIAGIYSSSLRSIRPPGIMGLMRGFKHSDKD